jgi:lipoyl(octanoyl) transferase
VTSLADLGWPVTMPEFDMALRPAFEGIFGETRDGGCASPRTMAAT